MRKRIGKLVWWLPVINALVVGLILWMVNGLNWNAVWMNEAAIGLFILAYIVLVIQLPIEDDRVAPTDEQDKVTQSTVNADLVKQQQIAKPFLGHRYPAGTRRKTGGM